MENPSYQQGKYPSPSTPLLHQQPQTTVVIPQQPATGQPDLDYSFPHGKIPSIVVFLVGIANVLFFISYGAVYGSWAVLLAPPFIFHWIAGVIGALGSFQVRRTLAVAVCTIIFGVISAIIAFWRVIQEGVGITGVDSSNSLVRPLYISLIFYVIFEVAALVCSILLTVFAAVALSKTRRSGGFIIRR